MLFVCAGDWIASDVDQIEDHDILEVYGPEDTTAATVQLSSYTFEVRLRIGTNCDEKLSNS